MRLQALENDEVITHTRTDDDFLGFEASIAVIEEYNLPRSRLKDSRGGYDELAAQIALYIDVDEHSRLQLESGVGNSQTHPNGAGRHVHLRQNLLDLPRKGAPRI